jgi:hypothetical protein
MDEATWREVWAKDCQIIIFPPQPLLPPPVNFAEEMVIGILLGPRSDSGYRVEIRTIEDRGVKYVVRAVETVEGRIGAITLPTIINPHHYVKTARRDAPVEFILTKEIIQ